MKPSRLDYCKFLWVSQKNYTMTYFSDRSNGYSHDAIKRMMESQKLSSHVIWEHTKSQIVPSPNGYLAFDDTILDKQGSTEIELVHKHYSGNAHKVIGGICMVNCVYINPETDQFWLIDYRIYSPDQDKKTKFDHVKEMLINSIFAKSLIFKGVLFDSWYSSNELMLLVHDFKKVFVCPIKSNRLVDDSNGALSYQQASKLTWSENELATGKVIKIKKFPKDFKVKLFQVAVMKDCMEYVVTNDVTQNSSTGIREVTAYRWRIEQFHREVKQTTGIERCQCRKARIQRNHIACCVLVWIRMKETAKNLNTTIYQLKAAVIDGAISSAFRSKIPGWV